MLRKLGVAISAFGFAAGVLALDIPAQAQGLQVGVLTCNVASGFGFIFGSSRAVNCAFSPQGRSLHNTMSGPSTSSVSISAICKAG